MRLVSGIKYLLPDITENPGLHMVSNRVVSLCMKRARIGSLPFQLSNGPFDWEYSFMWK